MWLVTQPNICKRDQIKITGELPHLSGLSLLPGVPHIHINRPFKIIGMLLKVVHSQVHWGANKNIITKKSNGFHYYLITMVQLRSLIELSEKFHFDYA